MSPQRLKCISDLDAYPKSRQKLALPDIDASPRFASDIDSSDDVVVVHATVAANAILAKVAMLRRCKTA